MTRMGPGLVALGVLLLSPGPGTAQSSFDWSDFLSPLGVAGAVVETDQPAFAVGMTLSFPLKTLELGGDPVVLSVRGGLELEAIQRQTEPGIVLSEDKYFYRCESDTHQACDSVHQAVEPFTAEADTQKRAFGAAYLTVSWRRMLLGGGVARDFCGYGREPEDACGEGDGGITVSALLGFATAKHSLMVLEVPALVRGGKEWRLRFELQGREILW